jgi:uncharacterized protein YprB with RNaseH-like and TPR domain
MSANNMRYNTLMPKPTLADKLKSLGVKVGTSDLKPPEPKVSSGVPIEETLDGRWVSTPLGDAFVSETRYPLEYRHGIAPLFSPAPLHNLASWANDARLREMPLGQFAFLDTETSGLAGGTGTYAFLIGVGRFEKAADGSEDFHLAQFFMRDPAEETALLAALEDFLAPCEALVTFNGKAFDAPLLATRYRLHLLPVPFADYAHVDLLPLARRLWRDRLPSRALKYLEENVLSAPRTIEEVPGYEIPYLYFDFLRTSDATPLKGVFYHNAMDVVAMTALFSHMAGLLADPHAPDHEFGLDVVALAKLFEDLGMWEDAARLYERGLEIGMPEEGFWEAVRRLSVLQRRRGDLEAAVRLWEKAAAEGHIYAHIELSKHYEHRMKDPKMALRWAKSAYALSQAKSLPSYERKHWEEDLTKRIERLEGKVHFNKGKPAKKKKSGA